MAAYEEKLIDADGHECKEQLYLRWINEVKDLLTLVKEQLEESNRVGLKRIDFLSWDPAAAATARNHNSIFSCGSSDGHGRGSTGR